jgi:hypothetical protein
MHEFTETLDTGTFSRSIIDTHGVWYSAHFAAPRLEVRGRDSNGRAL